MPALTTLFSVTSLGTPGDRVAFSPQGAVAVGFARKPGYLRTPTGKKTPLPEGFLPWCVTSKGTVGGQLAGRAAVIKSGVLTTLFPEQTPVGPTTVLALAGTTELLLFGTGRERQYEGRTLVDWQWSLRRGDQVLEDSPVALSEDGWYITASTSAPERVLGSKRQRLTGLPGQDWTNATHIARGGLACGYTESSGPGYVNAVWWDSTGGVHRLSPPVYKGRDKTRTWYGARAHRINARGDVLGTATLEGKYPVGLRAALCQETTELELLWPRSGKPILLNELFLRGSYGRLITVEGLADTGTLLVRTLSGKQERLLLLKPKR